jgi:hypothetical protein
VFDSTQLKTATPDERQEVAMKAVQAAADPEEKKEVAAAAVDALTPKQREELIKSMWPSESKHRKAIYVWGFVIAGAVAVSLGAIAWQAQDAANSISASLVVLATGFASAMLGGLLGAYVQR